MKKYITTTTFIILSFYPLLSFSQHDPVNRSFEINIGAGVSDGAKLMGGGYNFSISYMKAFKHERLKFYPRFDIAFMGARLILDAPDQYFNSINFDILFSYDLLRFKGIALNVNAGPSLNTRKGLLGTGGMPPGRTQSEYTTSSAIAFSFGGGIRIEPQSEDYYVILHPLNFRIGSDYFFEGFAKLGIGFKF